MYDYFEMINFMFQFVKNMLFSFWLNISLDIAEKVFFLAIINNLTSSYHFSYFE
jgi:hypothetical protein